MSIISQNQQDEKLFYTIAAFFKNFKIGDLLRKCNACKQKGVPVLDIFKYKLCNIFSDRSMYMQMKTNSYREAFSKNTFYDPVSWIAVYQKMHMIRHYFKIRYIKLVSVRCFKKMTLSLSSIPSTRAFLLYFGQKTT